MNEGKAQQTSWLWKGKRTSIDGTLSYTEHLPHQSQCLMELQVSLTRACQKEACAGSQPAPPTPLCHGTRLLLLPLPLAAVPSAGCASQRLSPHGGALRGRRPLALQGSTGGASSPSALLRLPGDGRGQGQGGNLAQRGSDGKMGGNASSDTSASQGMQVTKSEGGGNALRKIKEWCETAKAGNERREIFESKKQAKHANSD